MCHSPQIGYELAKARIEDMHRDATTGTAERAPHRRRRWTSRQRAAARLARALMPAMHVRRERRL